MGNMDFINLQPLTLYAILGGLLFFLLLISIWLWKRSKSPISPSNKKEITESLEERLSGARKGWVSRLQSILTSGSKIDDHLYQELEEVLITADIGVRTSQALMERIQENQKRSQLKNPALLKDLLLKEISKVLLKSNPGNGSLENKIKNHKPYVVMMVGVNGVGKTTTIGKLTQKWVKEGKTVMLGAGDTFRAAASEQLKIWGARAGVEVISQKEGTHPSAVAFDAVSSALAKGVDILILDTAGRFHTKVNLMEELKKVVRTIKKKIEDAPHEIWLVLDATTGQNALQQAKSFHGDLGGITGIILTKLDGTAKGGVIISLAEELPVPIRFIGVGEKASDLRPFDPDRFSNALFT